jgi:hypothetical protein
MKAELNDLRLVDLRKIATKENLEGRSKYKTKKELSTFLKENLTQKELNKYIKRFPISRASPKYKVLKGKISKKNVLDKKVEILLVQDGKGEPQQKDKNFQKDIVEKNKNSGIPIKLELSSRSLKDLRQIALNYNVMDNKFNKKELVNELIQKVTVDDLLDAIEEYPILPGLQKQYQKKIQEIRKNLKECNKCKKLKKQKEFPCRKKKTVFWRKKDMEEYCDMKKARKVKDAVKRRLIVEWANQDFQEELEQNPIEEYEDRPKKVRFQ